MMAVLSILLLLLTLTDAATGLFWRQHYYVKLSKSWTEAQAYCKQYYVDLSIIDAQLEFDSFRNQTGYNSGWIGLRKNPGDINFTHWSDGQEVNFSMWKTGQPEKPVDQHCVFISGNVWVNGQCTETKNFFCYTWSPQLIVVQEMKNWEEALVHCRTHYIDLVSLTNETDRVVVNNRKTEIQTPAFWTSLRFMDGSWYWVNEKCLANLTSLPSCPAKPFRCGARNHQTGVWENRDCQEKMNFICYH